MNRTRTAATATLTALALTGCAPGWEGTGTVVELEYMTPELEGTTIDHDGLEITVITDTDREEAVQVEDCDPGQIILGDRITVTDITTRCGELSHSTDD